MVIRPITTADARPLSALAKRSWADAFGEGISPEDLAAELESGRSEAYFTAAITDERKTILVAEDDGVLLGYVEFGDVEIVGIERHPGDRGLHRVYVETALQGRGIGRRLTEAALAQPRLAQASRVFLQVWDANERAVRLYRHFGFKRIGTTQFTVGDKVMEDAVYVRHQSDDFDDQ
jgi:diamine N-acetyltransferase